ncbi:MULTISPECIES: hypothetical protein [unclassified Streptomyces]|nr:MULTISPECIES: hypothetical protein [unclassified Streptomyces]
MTEAPKGIEPPEPSSDPKLVPPVTPIEETDVVHVDAPAAAGTR